MISLIKRFSNTIERATNGRYFNKISKFKISSYAMFFIWRLSCFIILMALLPFMLLFGRKINAGYLKWFVKDISFNSYKYYKSMVKAK